MIATRDPVKLRGLLRFLLHPFRVIQDLLDALSEFAIGRVGWIALWLAVGVALFAAWRLLIAWRDRRTRQSARRIRVLPPPEARPDQARLLWMSLHALLRPWWKRLILGQPYIGFELLGRPEEIELGLWVPEVVPPGLVERAVEVAFPGARTEHTEADPIEELLAGDGLDLEACELRLAEPEWFPLGEGEVGEEPLSLALAALTGLAEGEAAFIQLLARPRTSRARRRLLRAARVLRAGGRPGSGSWRVDRGGAGHRPAPDPTVEGDVRAILAKAASPLWACTLRVAVCSEDGGQARGRIHGLAGAFAVFEGRNGLRRRRCPRSRHAISRRLPGRSVLLSVPELSEIATVPPAGAVAGLERAGAKTSAPSKALPQAGRVLGRELARRVAREWVRDEALVPLSIFSLDHPEPLVGWGALLQARGIELVTDDLYRPAIRREDARQLAEERREWERESAEKANRLQEEFEAPPVFGGVPALENGSAMESLMAHDPSYQTPQAEFGQRPKPNFLAEELEAGQRKLAAERAAIAERKKNR